jgi:Tol biopolymer transport system component
MRPITTYRGGEYGPVMSRDGQRIAFVWRPDHRDHFDVYVRSVEGEDLSQVTSRGYGGRKRMLVPGRWFARILRYGETIDSTIVVRRLVQGEERAITSVFPIRQIHDRHVDWSPVADDLAIADKTGHDEPYAIYLISIATGQRRRLTNPPPGSRGDTGAVFSRDGRTIAFRRTLGASVTDIYVVPVSGGEPRRLTIDGVHTSTHDWTADGREIVFSSSREGGFALWRVPVSGGKPRPVSVPPHGANYLSIAGERLAFSIWFADTNIWRYSAVNAQEKPREPLIASTQADISPQESPDGTAIAFRSNRTGTDEIWRANSDGTRERALTNFKGPLTGSPRWSPDGRRIAFDSRPGGKANIFVIDRSGGTPVQITRGGGNNVVPSWSADGRWIYYSSNRTGTWQVWRISAEPHTEADGAVQVTRRGGFAPFESRDGRFVYYAKGENTGGLWRVPVQGGDEELFCPEPLGGLWGQWGLGPRGVYLVDADAHSARLIHVDYDSRSKKVIRDLPVRPFWNDGGLSISPDGKWILYAQADSSGSDIYIVDNFR